MMPRAVCGGQEPLRIGDVEMPCYVLDDERRVITLVGLFQPLKIGTGGGLSRLVGLTRQLSPTQGIANDLSCRLETPIEFVMPKGGVANGYEATLLSDICDAILESRKRGLLPDRYAHVAEAAEVLMRGFAVVGIIALIDEATGYEKVRKRLALADLLDKYLDDNLNKWTKTFPDEFYEELFRLKGWDYAHLQAGDVKPAEVGKFTKEQVYRRLHPGIVSELEARNPEVVPGRRMYKHHQWLSREIGHVALEKHIAQILVVMKLSKDWQHFMANLQRVLPLPESDTDYFGFVSEE